MAYDNPVHNELLEATNSGKVKDILKIIRYHPEIAKERVAVYCSGHILKYDLHSAPSAYCADILDIFVDRFSREFDQEDKDKLLFSACRNSYHVHIDDNCRDFSSAVKKLIDYGANKNQLTTVGDNLIHVAAGAVTSNTVKVLIDENVNRYHKNNKGETPYNFATEDLQSVTKMLEEYYWMANLKRGRSELEKIVELLK